MNIDALSVKLRKRGLWEAVDLGFLLAQKHFLPLWLTWWVGALPIALVLGAVFYQLPLWMCFAVWFFKPIYENVMLSRLSKLIFGEQAPLKPVMASFKQANKGRLFYSLILSRLMLNRSFSSPVSLLEGQKGKSRKLRLSQLSMSMQNVTQFTTILLFLIEFGLTWAIIVVFFTVFPSDFVDHSLSAVLEDELFLHWGYTLIACFVMSLIAPFYVCAGFALYLSRRTELEAWDIELNFKKLTARIETQKNKRQTNARQSSKATVSSYIAVLMACACVFVSVPTPSFAAESESPSIAVSDEVATPHTSTPELTQQEAKDRIREILSGDEFGSEKTKYRWVRKQPDKKVKARKESDFDLDDFFEFVTSIVNGLAFTFKLILVGLLLIGVAYVLSHSKGMWGGLSGFFNRSEDVELPSHLFGLDMKKDSLPKNVTEQCRALIRDEKYREALALLLRASFINVLHQQHIPIPASATEKECLRLFQKSVDIKQYDFLDRLIHQWILVAYAHESPSESELLTLCEQWHQLYEAKASSALTLKAGAQ